MNDATVYVELDGPNHALLRLETTNVSTVIGTLSRSVDGWMVDGHPSFFDFPDAESAAVAFTRARGIVGSKIEVRPSEHLFR